MLTPLTVFLARHVITIGCLRTRVLFYPFLLGLLSDCFPAGWSTLSMYPTFSAVQAPVNQIPTMQCVNLWKIF